MNSYRRSLQVGKAAIAWALVLRLWMAGVPERVLRRLSQPDMASFLIYLETGRDVRFSLSRKNTVAAFSRESPAPVLPEPDRAVFSRQEAEDIAIRYSCQHRPDLQALLTQPLDWNLADGEKRVLILHTHATESYTQEGEDYEESGAYRTLDEDWNMLCIGSRVAEILEQQGIGVIHDTTLHDYPSYNGSYGRSRETAEKILAENPGIRLILDLHRDAAGTVGNQLRTQAETETGTASQLMLVLGTNHDHWQENLALGEKLYVLLERDTLGIMRPISLTEQRFNQDLCSGSLLIEVGAAGNTRQEALLAAEKLAQAIAALGGGSEEIDN